MQGFSTLRRTKQQAAVSRLLLKKLRVRGWGGGGQRPKKSLCTRNGPQVSGPFDKFHFLPQQKFSDVGGGWVCRGWPGPQTTPPPGVTKQ